MSINSKLKYYNIVNKLRINITSKYAYIFTIFDAYLQATMYINVRFPVNWWPSKYSEKKPTTTLWVRSIPSRKKLHQCGNSHGWEKNKLLMKLRGPSIIRWCYCVDQCWFDMEFETLGFYIILKIWYRYSYTGSEKIFNIGFSTIRYCHQYSIDFWFMQRFHFICVSWHCKLSFKS